MTERDPAAVHAHQPCVLRCFQRLRVKLEQAEGLDDRLQPRRRAERRDEQRRPGALGEAVGALGEHPLDGRTHRHRVRDRLQPLKLPRREQTGQLDQRERTPAGGPADALDHFGAHVRPGVRRHERRRRLVVDAAELQRLERPGAEGIRFIGAGGDNHRNALGCQPPTREDERVGRRGIDPLRIVE